MLFDYLLCEVSVSLCALSFIFFFQAEDGIRDLVRSRGLGDVYKRQVSVCSGSSGWLQMTPSRMLARAMATVGKLNASVSVSYTHLTLPTSDLV